MPSPVLITCGDVSGISPEIIVKSLKKLSLSERKDIVLIGKKDIFLRYGFSDKLCSFFSVEISNFKFIKGRPNKYSGLLSFKALEVAIKLSQRFNIKAIVTAPISKYSWKLAGIKYLGHTDYFRKKFKKDMLMSFKFKDVNTALLTEHVPLKNVSSYINRKNILDKVKFFDSFLRKIYGKSRILIACLNPHCGDGGVISDEEEKIIKPAVRFLRKKGYDVKGPFITDTIYEKYYSEKANGILFMYHDQLLSTLKYFGSACDIIHITYGLPFLRVSPAHGTAFDIAGKNIADYRSMLSSIKFALKEGSRYY